MWLVSTTSYRIQPETGEALNPSTNSGRNTTRHAPVGPVRNEYQPNDVERPTGTPNRPPHDAALPITTAQRPLATSPPKPDTICQKLETEVAFNRLGGVRQRWANIGPKQGRRRRPCRKRHQNTDCRRGRAEKEVERQVAGEATRKNRSENRPPASCLQPMFLRRRQLRPIVRPVLQRWRRRRPLFDLFFSAALAPAGDLSGYHSVRVPPATRVWYVGGPAALAHAAGESAVSPPANPPIAGAATELLSRPAFTSS